MIRFLQHQMIDKPRWDECIDHAMNGNLYAISWFLDIVSPGWCALIDGEYVKVFPLPVSSKAGIHYIMQPLFTQQLGLFYKSVSTEENAEEFLKSIPPEYKYIDFNLNTSNKIKASAGVFEMINLELDLTSEYQDLASGYQNNLQRNIKKAAQNKLTISKQVSPEEIISLFRNNKGLDLSHLNNNEYAIIQKIASECIQKGIGEIWGAYDEFNQLVAAILWITINNKAIFLFSALSETGKKLNAMPWLIDAFIKQNSGKPLVLDFEGSNNEGLARFYSSFGAKKVIYQRYVYNSLPRYFRIGLKLWRLSRTKLKKYLLMSKQ